MKPQTIWQGGAPVYYMTDGGKLRVQNTSHQKRKWSDDELAFLRKHYTSEGASDWLCSQLQRTAQTVRAAARRQGLCVSDIRRSCIARNNVKRMKS